MTSPFDLTPNLDPQDGSAREMLLLTLYTAGNSLNSLRALANINDICEDHFKGHYQLEVVDIFEHPLRALVDKILVTPTLVRTAPGERLLIVGSLSEKQTVVLALQGTERTP